jgi:hypothetical protein
MQGDPFADKKQWIAELSKLAWISWKYAGLRRRAHQDLTRIATDGHRALSQIATQASQPHIRISWGKRVGIA